MTAQGVTARALVLLVGDWLALGLFVFLGQIDHDLLTIGRWLGQTLLLAIPWTISALLLNAYTLPGENSLWAYLRRSLLAWLVAAPLALLARALIQGQATIIVVFMLVTMGLGGLFLLGWRTAYYFIGVRRSGA